MGFSFSSLSVLVVAGVTCGRSVVVVVVAADVAFGASVVAAAAVLSDRCSVDVVADVDFDGSAVVVVVADVSVSFSDSSVVGTVVADDDNDKNFKPNPNASTQANTNDVIKRKYIILLNVGGSDESIYSMYS